MSKDKNKINQVIEGVDFLINNKEAIKKAVSLEKINLLLEKINTLSKITNELVDTSEIQTELLKKSA